MTDDMTIEDLAFEGSAIFFDGVRLATLTGVDVAELTEFDFFLF